MKSGGIEGNVSDLLRAKTIEKLTQKNLVPAQLSNDACNKSSEELLTEMSKNGYFACYVEITQIAIQLDSWVAIYLEDPRYFAKPWQVIKNTEDPIIKPSNLIFLSLKQGADPSKPLGGHYSTLIPVGSQPNASLNTSIKILLGQSNKDSPIHKLNIMVWNSRSIRSYAKQSILHRVLTENNIHIAMISETFLISEDKIPISKYRVFRADNTIRRRGVLILISTEVAASASILSKCENGRYIKVRLSNDILGSSLTISCTYLEPHTDLDEFTIPSLILLSDIVGGDMNNSHSGLDRLGVYHLKGIKTTKQVEVSNSLSDHNIVIGTIETSISTKPAQETRTILSIRKRDDNLIRIEKFLLGNSNSINFTDPYITVPITNLSYPNQDIGLAEEWEFLKQKEEELLRERNSSRQYELNKLLSSGKYDEETFDKIGSLLQLKKKSILYFPDSKLESYVKGFKELYKDNGSLRDFKNPYKVAISHILREVDLFQDRLASIGKLQLPKTKAYDKFGFTQRWLWSIINYQSDNRLDNLTKFKFLFNALWGTDANLFHNQSRMILFNKVDEPADWTQFRPISIIPAWMAILEKLISPVVKFVTNDLLSKNQMALKILQVVISQN